MAVSSSVDCSCNECVDFVGVVIDVEGGRALFYSEEGDYQIWKRDSSGFDVPAYVNELISIDPDLQVSFDSVPD